MIRSSLWRESSAILSCVARRCAAWVATAHFKHRDAEARLYYLEALPLVRGPGSEHIEAVVECNLSQISARLGQHRDALVHARWELALRREWGDLVGEAYALHDMAVAEQGLGNHNAAIEFGERARALYRTTVGTEQFVADVHETLAISLNYTGDHLRARRYLREAVTILSLRGDPHAESLLERVEGEGAVMPLNTRNGATHAVAARPARGGTSR